MKLKMILIARNIVNQETITDFISEVSEDQNDKIKSWCNSILKNYLKNEYPNLRKITKTKNGDPEWLKLAVQNKDAQEIIITDEFKRNLLEHIFPYFKTLTGNIKHSFSEAEKKTKEWDDRKSKFNIKFTKGVKELLKCENGYIWFEIIDEETLYNEGEVLQNCLRENQSGKIYWKRLIDKKIKIFTLRDNKGVGHVCVEYNIDEDEVKQMLGKQNSEPIEIYHPFCIKLLNYLKCNINNDVLVSLNLVMINTKIYNIFNLPENLKVDGTLDLSYSNIMELPNNLEITNNLILYNSKLIRLPDNLNIGGNLDLVGTVITELPTTLKIKKRLYLDNSKITTLPDNFEIGGSLYLGDSKISELPDNLKIGLNLYLDDSKIKSLPNNLEIGGSLYLEDSIITKLPDTLKVSKFIYTNKYVKLTYIPASLLNKIKTF